jgi:hypothetical protein
MKKRILLSAAMLVAAGLFASAAVPADLGALSGSVVGDDMTTPLAGAVVRVVNVADGQEYLSPPSGPNGLFELSGIAEGRYAVTVISGGSSFTLKDRLSIKGRETGDLRLSIGRDRDMSGGAAEPAIGEQMSKITIGCIKPPKPPKPPKSKHKGRDRDHEHDDD